MLPISPVRSELTACELVPEPADCEEVRFGDARMLSVPHSNHIVVERPLGIADPFSVAVEILTAVAAEVVELGDAPVAV